MPSQERIQVGIYYRIAIHNQDRLAVQEGSRARDGTTCSQGFRFHHSPDLQGCERACFQIRQNVTRSVSQAQNDSPRALPDQPIQ